MSEQIVDRAELRRMAPDEVVQALADGRLDELFAGGAASPLSGTRERLSRMSPGEVVAALNAGELDDFLAGRVE